MDGAPGPCGDLARDFVGARTEAPNPGSFSGPTVHLCIRPWAAGRGHQVKEVSGWSVTVSSPRGKRHHLFI